METGLYYLQSRYYDPETGRFLNADTVEYLEPETVNGLNLYAYCLNNPVMYSDPSGHSIILTTIAMIVAGTLIGGVISGGINAAAQLNQNGGDFSELNWGSILNDTLVGAATGFSLAMGVACLGPFFAGATVSTAAAMSGMVASVVVSFAAGTGGYVIEKSKNNEEISIANALTQGSFVAMQGLYNYCIGGFLGSFGTIGLKGKLLISKEWWKKLIIGNALTQPFKIVSNMARSNYE